MKLSLISQISEIHKFLSRALKKILYFIWKWPDYSLELEGGSGCC